MNELHSGFHQLGHSGLKVSRLCLGTMMFGKQTDEATSRRIIDQAFEQGVNFIDTANVYNGGASEEVVGRAIAERRDDWVVATKVGSPMGDQSLPHRRGLSRKHMHKSVHDSLARMGTDHIDLLYLHREDHDTPVEEYVATLGDLIRHGLVRHFGISNHRGWKTAEIVRACDQLGVDRPIATQPLYNAVNRQAEQEVFTAAEHFDMAVVPYSPLARGVLTGKYAPGEKPGADTRAGHQDKRMMETEWREESLVVAQKIADHARSRDIEPAEFALAWVMNNDLVTSAIVGPRTEAHWDSYIRALDIELTEEDEALVDSLITPGHASTPGFNDPAHFVSGRYPRS
ncbi:aldo/keto reductase [Salinisphaera aquimarina]|uniref:Aldo/keto reductase n=1 Tax=Salinisphaera aquimarina TaxID=2094031 RepID=A0ABV7EUN6_9GAMM